MSDNGEETQTRSCKSVGDSQLAEPASWLHIRGVVVRSCPRLGREKFAGCSGFAMLKGRFEKRRKREHVGDGRESHSTEVAGETTELL